MKTSESSDTVTRYSVIQSLTEIGLGSILHAFSVPFGGHFMSMNQALILTFASRQTSGRRDAVSSLSAISLITALLKSLSPMGKRLGPMLAISTQGLLFTTGVAVIGRNIAGILVGATLLSLWPFFHPLLTAYLFFGGHFFEALEKIWAKLAAATGMDPALGIWIIIVVMGIKAAMSAALVLAALIFGERFETSYFEKLERLKSRAPVGERSRRARPYALVLNPWFLASLGLSVGFFLFSQDPGWTETLFYLARIVGVGLLLMVIVPWLIARLPAGAFPRLQAVARKVSRNLEDLSS